VLDADQVGDSPNAVRIAILDGGVGFSTAGVFLAL
jgi:hypothetical protein